MKRLGKAVLVAGVLTLGAAACFSDPTSDLRGDAARLQLSQSYLLQTVGDTDQVNIQVVDAQGNVHPVGTPTYQSLDANVATMAHLPDSATRTDPGGVIFKSIVVGLNPGLTQIVVTAAGVSDTLTVAVTPAGFTGSITPNPAVPGDLITITAPAGVVFDANTFATYDAGAGFMEEVSRTSTTLVYRAGADEPAGATVTVHDALLSGTTLVLPPLASTATLVVAQANEPSNDTPAGAQTTITKPAAVGDSVVFYGSTSDTDIDDYFAIALAAGDSIEVVLSWTGDADVDLYLTNAAGASQTGFSGATGTNNPERVRFRVTTAGTYRIQIQMYDTHGAAVPHGYKVIVYRRA